MNTVRQPIPVWVLGWVTALAFAPDPAAATVDLGITAAADRLTVEPGVSGSDLVNFTITLTNDGPDPADAIVTSVLPAGLSIPAGLSPEPGQGTYDPASGRWDVGYLGAGAVAVLRIPAQAITGAAGCLFSTSTASLASGTGMTDIDPANDSARATVGAPACADLAVTATRTDGTSVNCFDARHRFRITNGGPNLATNVRLLVTRYEVTAPASFSEPSCTTGNVVVPGPAVVALGTLTAGETREFDTGLLNLQRTGPNITVAFAVNAVAVEPDPDAANSATSGSYVINRTGVLGGDGDSTTCIISGVLGSTPFADLLPRLRTFRDRYLMAQPAGRGFVAWYGRVSPVLVRMLQDHERFRDAVGWGLGLAMALAIGAAEHPAATSCAALLALMAAWRRRQNTATDLGTSRPKPTRTGMPSRRR